MPQTKKMWDDNSEAARTAEAARVACVAHAREDFPHLDDETSELVGSLLWAATGLIAGIPLNIELGVALVGPPQTPDSAIDAMIADLLNGNGGNPLAGL